MEPSRSALAECCVSRRWLAAVLAGSPYGGLDDLLAASDAALAALDWPDVLEALAAHPRIGDRPVGAGQEASWSRQEQSGAAAAADGTAEQLRRRNVTYEQRFGFVFLICATGLSAEQMLAALQERLDHDPVEEQAVVRDELGAIVRLRLGKAFG